MHAAIRAATDAARTVNAAAISAIRSRRRVHARRGRSSARRRESAWVPVGPARPSTRRRARASVQQAHKRAARAVVRKSRRRHASAEIAVRIRSPARRATTAVGVTRAERRARVNRAFACRAPTQRRPARATTRVVLGSCVLSAASASRPSLIRGEGRQRVPLQIRHFRRR
jgi:hypothetical protein